MNHERVGNRAFLDIHLKYFNHADTSIMLEIVEIMRFCLTLKLYVTFPRSCAIFFILIFFSNIYSFTLKIPELYDKEWRYIPVFITTYSFIFYDISVYCKMTRLYEKMWSKSQDNQLKLLEFDRVFLAVLVEKISQEL